MKLSAHQQKVLNNLRNGLFIWTDEGSNFKAWLGDDRGKNIESIRTDTVNALLNLKVITFIDGNYPQRLVKYGLTQK